MFAIFEMVCICHSYAGLYWNRGSKLSLSSDTSDINSEAIKAQEETNNKAVARRGSCKFVLSSKLKFKVLLIRPLGGKLFRCESGRNIKLFSGSQKE